ncbi:DUF4214 domain-containing protein [Campylobacter sputorum]|uniref:DUF4214 domain-containing protein n=1 Tax=Campylobacter sputorum TaxID=206 RepID=UPI00053BDDE9|nr:DUF4214 domain-containing protein [Campylobacter sputorum]
MAITEAQVAKMYVLALGRNADASGAKYWLDLANKGNFTEEQLLGAVIDTDAAKKEWGDASKSNEAFVDHVYKNILGREPDAEGKAYWVGILSQNGGNKTKTILDMYYSAIVDPKGDQGAKDKAVFEAKVALSQKSIDAGVEFTDPKFEELTKIFQNTTRDNIETQTEAFDKLLKSTIYQLTENDDNVVGTSGDDYFSGVAYVGNGFNKSTLNPLDKIDGGEGIDTLDISYKANNFASNNPLNNDLDDNRLSSDLAGVKNVENLVISSELGEFNVTDSLNGYNKLNITNVGGNTSLTSDAKDVSVISTGTTTIRTAEATDVNVKSGHTATVNAAKAKNINVTSDSDGATVNAAEAENVVVNAKNLSNISAEKATTAKIDLGSNDKVLTPTLTNVVDLSLANLSVGAVTLNQLSKLSLDNVTQTATLTTNSKEIDLTINKMAKVDLTAASLTSLVLSGDAAEKGTTLDLNKSVSLTNFDASSLNGDLELTAKNVADSTIKLGSGNDVLKLDATAEKQTIDGGDGTDLLVVESATAETGEGSLVINNFEGLQISDELNNDVNMDQWEGFNYIELTKGVNAGAPHTITNLLSDSTIKISKTAIAAQDLTLEAKDANNVINLILDPQSTVAGLDLSANTVKLQNIETLNLTSLEDTAKSPGAKNQFKVSADANLKTLNVKGDEATKLTFADEATGLKTIDASDLTANLEADISAARFQATTFKGGSGDDSIKFHSKSKDLVITGGDGNDTFIVHETPFINAAAKTTTDMAKIADFEKGDKLTIGNLEAGKVVKYDVDKNLDFSVNFNKAVEMANGSASKVAYFTYTDINTNSTDTYVVSSTDGIRSAAVKLAGTIDLANATIDADTETITL